MQARETFCRFSTDGRGICDWEDESFSIGCSCRKENFLVMAGDRDSKSLEILFIVDIHSTEVGDATELNSRLQRWFSLFTR